MDSIPKFTGLDYVVMEVLWNSKKDMTIQQIVHCLEKKEISVSSVSQAIRRLLKKKAVEQVGVVPVATVYARTFRACVSKEAVTSDKIRRLNIGMSSMKLAMALLKSAPEDEVIDAKELKEMQQILNAKKKKLK